MVGGGPGPGLGYSAVFGIQGLIDGVPTDRFDGVTQSYLGIGFDIAGNFCLSGFGVAGFQDPRPNTITVRGSQNYQYRRLATTPNLSSFKVPFTLYQTITSNDDIKFSTIRIRLTDFAKRILIDIKPSGAPRFVQYADILHGAELPPISLACGLGFASGLTDTQFAVKNFNINGVFTDVAAWPTLGTIFWTYSGAYYFGMNPNPVATTVSDTFQITNAPPWDTYPPLILVSDTGSIPFINTDNYINIVYDSTI